MKLFSYGVSVSTLAALFAPVLIVGDLRVLRGEVTLALATGSTESGFFFFGVTLFFYTLGTLAVATTGLLAYALDD